MTPEKDSPNAKIPLVILETNLTVVPVGLMVPLKLSMIDFALRLKVNSRIYSVQLILPDVADSWLALAWAAMEVKLVLLGPGSRESELFLEVTSEIKILAILTPCLSVLIMLMELLINLALKSRLCPLNAQRPVKTMMFTEKISKKLLLPMVLEESKTLSKRFTSTEL